MTSAPLAISAAALALPFGGSWNPEKSPAGVRYSSSILILDETVFAPCRKPASNFWISGVLTPPTKPMWQLLLLYAAATPARNEPCSSAKTSGVTFGSVIESSSTMANLVFGYFAATTLTDGAYAKPTAMIGFRPEAAIWSRRCCLADSASLALAVLSLTVVTPRSDFALSVPAAAASLNDASPRTPTSQARPIFSLLPSTLPPAAAVLLDAEGAAGGFCAVTQSEPPDEGAALLLLLPPLESLAHPARASTPAMAAAASAVPRMRRTVFLPPR